MAIQYAGGTRVNYTFTDAGTRADLVSKLETQLGNAGWSTISGGGTGDVLMKSAVTPDGLSIRFRLYDPGSGNCAQITMKNNAGTLTSQTIWLLPASADWRIVANKYQFFMFRRGATNRALARGIAMGGTIWMPASQVTLLGSDKDCGWMQGTSTSDTDATARQSFRTKLTPIGTSPRASSLYTSFLIDVSDNPGLSQPTLMIPSLTVDTTKPSFAWQGGERHQMEALIGWSPDSSSSSRMVIKGQLWDGMVLSGQATGESTISYDGHTFIAITDQAADEIRGVGTLHIAVD
jgi:hypothetical protein